jgi:arginyl-tRNA synthetase
MWGVPDGLTVAQMNDLYVRFRQAMKDDPALEDRARQWFKRLEDGDPVARSHWQTFRRVSLAEFQTVYDKLGVRFDEVRGESAYEDAMPAVIRALEKRGLTSTSDDALVVDLAKEGMPPLLLKKSDGATLYATRDLAAALYRKQAHRFDRSLYVVDRGQALHFKQVFATLDKAGHPWAKRLEHVGFGLVRINGQKSGTRSGNVVLLRDVIAQAEARAAERIRAARPELDAATVTRLAEQVGAGAIIFANMQVPRDRDVEFDLEQVLSFDGGSGPFVQRMHARAARLVEQSGVPAGPPDRAVLARLGLPEEIALARALDELPGAVRRAAAENDPHHLARYLVDVSSAFSSWHALGRRDRAARVLTDDPELRAARVALAAATRETLKTGLSLLGIASPTDL